MPRCPACLEEMDYDAMMAHDSATCRSDMPAELRRQQHAADVWREVAQDAQATLKRIRDRVCSIPEDHDPAIVALRDEVLEMLELENGKKRKEVI